MDVAHEQFRESTQTPYLLQRPTRSRRRETTKSVERKTLRNDYLRKFVHTLKDVWEKGVNLPVQQKFDVGAPLSLKANGSFCAWKFPTSFSNFERHLIHETAEELKLDHESFGRQEDGSRHIVLSAPSCMKAGGGRADRSQFCTAGKQTHQPNASEMKQKDKDVAIQSHVDNDNAIPKSQNSILRCESHRLINCLRKHQRYHRQYRPVILSRLCQPHHQDYLILLIQC